MTNSKIQLGKLGEQFAENFLISQNYKIIAKNFRCKYGEIDLIAIDYSNKQELVFVEVKTRTTSKFGEPQDAITFSKKTKILKTALYFFNSSTEKLSQSWRSDAIGVKLNGNKRLREINHLKNIFDG